MISYQLASGLVVTNLYLLCVCVFFFVFFFGEENCSKRVKCMELRSLMKVEGRLSYDISSPSDSWGWFQHLTRLLSYQSGAWRWDGDTPRNHSKLNDYLSTDNEKKNHSSALCRMRWGNGGCEEIKNMKNFNEYNY